MWVEQTVWINFIAPVVIQFAPGWKSFLTMLAVTVVILIYPLFAIPEFENSKDGVGYWLLWPTCLAAMIISAIGKFSWLWEDQRAKRKHLF
jgi:hypothetical protein